MRNVIASAIVITAMCGAVSAGETAVNPGAHVYFVNIEDGDTIKSPFKVVFGLGGMGVAPAGAEADNTGHHHLFVDRAPFGDGAEDADLIENGIPADENHKHFGGGQTEVTIELEQGTHSLQLVMGDLYHVPHAQPVVSEVINITVE